MSYDLVSIHDLLRDPQYRKFFTTTPALPAHYTAELRPWKLMVQKKGESIWRSKRYGTYKDAFEGMKKMFPLIDNGAINCPPLGFMPPVKYVRIRGKLDSRGRPDTRTLVWRPQIPADLPDHSWCPHCRRPSIFKFAVMNNSRVHATTAEPALRCIICGVSDRLVNLRHPEKTQLWDKNRPKVKN